MMKEKNNKKDLNLTIEEIHELETEMLKEMHDICEKHNITYYLSGGSVLGAVRHKGPIPWDTDVDVVVPYNEYDNFLEKTRKELPDKFHVFYYDKCKSHRQLFARIGLKGYSSSLLHVDVFKLIGAPNAKASQIRFKRKAWVLQKLHIIKSVDLNEVDYSSGRKAFVRISRVFLVGISRKRIERKYDTLCKKYAYDESFDVVNIAGRAGVKEFSTKAMYGVPVKMRYSDYLLNVPHQTDNYLKNFYSDYMKLPKEEDRIIHDRYTILSL